MIQVKDISRDALLYCLNCKSECEFLDYKEKLYLENDKQLCDFAKDAVAMRNTGGGYILIGVEDKTWKPLGIDERFKYDSKMLRDITQSRKYLTTQLWRRKHVCLGNSFLPSQGDAVWSARNYEACP